jgi:hypothetical protein
MDNSNPCGKAGVGRYGRTAILPNRSAPDRRRGKGESPFRADAEKYWPIIKAANIKPQ